MVIGCRIKSLVQPMLAFCVLMGTSPVWAEPLPQLIHKNGHHALLVDGAPFLMLGAQANNSSNYPAALKDVWPSIEKMHANTLSIPVAWEQVEPTEGTFD